MGRALSDLKFIDQLIILFRYYENEQLDRIAQRLDMNVDAVSIRHQRALEKLRKVM